MVLFILVGSVITFVAFYSIFDRLTPAILGKRVVTDITTNAQGFGAKPLCARALVSLMSTGRGPSVLEAVSAHYLLRSRRPPSRLGVT